MESEFKASNFFKVNFFLKISIQPPHNLKIPEKIFVKAFSSSQTVFAV